uniref:Clp R domain-containing protein n=1 Tax=Cannabis sativa TaxID=3483 RepID=A0A803QAM6_CANSA
MRAGLSTIQQTLTPEAANVLNHSIAEAGRRNHGQTTPLHVAATLLASPSGYLRQACIKSHPNSSHPLQCRALELCFSVALERLPTAQNMSPGMEPPISNALMAALKRAQAHQRRGCPEQQQQPLLAVKVELEQLIISILDDPSVSRVMREASFSSPAVKATIEQSLNSSSAVAAASNNSSSCSPIGLGFRPAHQPSRNLYLNPRLQQQQGSATAAVPQRGEEVKRVLDILVRSKKRNPVLVGDSEPEAVMKELLKRIENRELLGGLSLQNVEIVHLDELSCDKTQIVGKIKDLKSLVETRMAKSNGGGVILNLGDLKWLVEQPPPSSGSEAGRAAVAEMAKLLAMFGDGGGGGGTGRLWLIGTATCETYLRCQVYHTSMENDWDLQAVPIASRAPVSGLFPRLGTNGILSSSVESLSPLKNFPTTAKLGPPRRLSENMDPSRRGGGGGSCCPQCNSNYEQELSKLIAQESEKSSSSSSEIKSEETTATGARPVLPQWLQNAKTSDQTQTKDQELVLKQKTQELQKKWNDTCLNLHPSFHHHHHNHQGLGSERLGPVTPLVVSPLSMTSLYNNHQNLLGPRQPFQPKQLQMNKSLGETLQLNTTNSSLVVSNSNQSLEKTFSPPGSPVRTDLVLGQTKVNGVTTDQQLTHKDRINDFLGCISSEQDNKVACKLDADSFKRLSKSLAEKIWWQPEAAVSVAATITECRLGNGKRRGAGSKGDMWLLFIGPDRVAKKKMASAVSELVSGSNPVTISLGSRRGDGEIDMSFRGKTVLDRVAEAVRRNPLSVIVLEDINEADVIVRGSIKRALERGRLVDSHGREISLGNVIFILTADWLPENLKYLSNGESINEEKLAGIARKAWKLRLSASVRTPKRRAHWLDDDQRQRKPRKETNSNSMGFDLNEMAAGDADDVDKADGSHNSSDLTIDHEDNECGGGGLRRPASLLGGAASSMMPRELLEAVDDTIVFKAADSRTMRGGIRTSIEKRFSAVIGDGFSLELDEDAAEKILSGVWTGRTSLEEWIEKVLVPSFEELKSTLSGSTMEDSMVVRLEAESESDHGGGGGNWLPVGVKVVVAGDA